MPRWGIAGPADSFECAVTLVRPSPPARHRRFRQGLRPRPRPAVLLPTQVGKYKVDALAATLARIDPEAEIATHKVRIDPAFARELYKGCHVIVEALDEAEAKAMFIETCLEAFPEIPVVAASGLAGLGHFESIRILHRGMLHICGDFENEVSRESPPVASRVAIVANLEADLALDLLLSSAPDN